MKTLIIATLILASVNCYSQKKPIDTTTSKTKIYMALNTRNSFFKRDEYEVKGSNHMNFTAVVLHNLTNELIIKGARLYAYGSIFSSTQGAVGTYFDDSEIDDIVKCLKYIIDNIDLEKKPANDTWVYYKTVDDFEIGARALKEKKYQIYLRKNYTIIRDEEMTMNRKDLTDVYDSFLAVKDFSKHIKFLY